MSVPTAPHQLRLLPAYLGVTSIEEALAHPRVGHVLWLEILVNDTIDWRNDPRSLVQEAYRTACRWYTTYRSRITDLIARSPLPADPGPIDFRELRTFEEALRYAAAHAR